MISLFNHENSMDNKALKTSLKRSRRLFKAKGFGAFDNCAGMADSPSFPDKLEEGIKKRCLRTAANAWISMRKSGFWKRIHHYLCLFGCHFGPSIRSGAIQLINKKNHEGISLKGLWKIRKCRWCDEKFTNIENLEKED